MGIPVTRHGERSGAKLFSRVQMVESARGGSDRVAGPIASLYSGCGGTGDEGEVMVALVLAI
jgi:hypothetical protein